MYTTLRILLVSCWIALSRAHIVITYPGERGNNLHTNGTLPEFDPHTIGIEYDKNGSVAFPYGMQWMYPCRLRSNIHTQTVRDVLMNDRWRLASEHKPDEMAISGRRRLHPARMVSRTPESLLLYQYGNYWTW